MTPTLVLVGGPMRADLKRHELSEALAEECPDLPVYEKRPALGVVTANAFDWVAVLGTAADVIAVGGALWAVYEKVIKKRLQSKTGRAPGFFIQVKNARHEFIQVVIQEETTEEVFLEEFTQKVSVMRATEADGSENISIEEYETSKLYRRIRKSKDA